MQPGSMTPALEEPTQVESPDKTELALRMAWDLAEAVRCERASPYDADAVQAAIAVAVDHERRLIRLGAIAIAVVVILALALGFIAGQW